MIDILDEGLKRLDIDINYNEEEFLKFYELLKEKNKVVDLTNIIEYEDVMIKHFLDSLTLFKFDEFKEEKTIIDIGTGAGFPGIPIKLVNKDLKITLLDSLNKRLVFLDEVIDKLNLKDIHTLHRRSEDIGNEKEYREKYDIAVSRAVSRMDKLVEMALPLVKVGGLFIAMKGKDTEDELNEALEGISILGGKVKNVVEFTLTEGENERTLIVVEKIKKTPKKYPRNFGQIKKKPL